MAPPARDRVWIDDAAGRLIRPYTVSEGRTRPSARLDLVSLMVATGRATHVHTGPEHTRALRLCRGPISVAEIAAHLRLPLAVTKVLLSDLVECGAVSCLRPPEDAARPTERELLEAVLHGLRTRL